MLIIGGGSGMGLETARLAAKAGAKVAVSGRTSSKLEQVAKSIEGDVETYPADASDADALKAMLRDLAPLDHVVVSVSSSGSASNLPNTPPDLAKRPFERFWIAYGVVHLAEQFVAPGGSVTLISGSSGRRPAAGYGFYSTLHSAIEGLARAAALELAPIRVNVVSPGGIGIRPDSQLVHHRSQSQDVAAMILALLVNPAMTNAVIDVDGGERFGTWSG